MWGLSGVAGQFKRTINAVASEIKDAVEEVRGLDEEPHPVAVGGLGPKPLSVSAPSSTRGAGPGGTASRLEAIKARLQAERAGSTGSRRASSASLDQSQAHPHDQGWAHNIENAQGASAVEVATSPIRFGPASTAAASSTATASACAPSNMQGSAQPDGSREQGGNLQASDMSTSGAHQPFSISQPQLHRQAEGSPGRLMPRQQSSPGRTEPLQAKRSESAQLLDAASKRNDSHARIMELQVRLKEEQAEKARLKDQLASSQPGSIPFSSDVQPPEDDSETAFWSSRSADIVGYSSAEAKAPSLAADTDHAAPHQRLHQSRAEPDEQVHSERAAHAATRQRLESQQRQEEILKEQVSAAQTALHAEQRTSSKLQADLLHAQALHAMSQQQLESHSSVTLADHSQESALQAEAAMLKAAAAQAETRLHEEQQQHRQSLQALEEARAGRSAALAELEAGAARHRQEQDAACRAQHKADAAAHALAAEQASHAETQRQLLELQSALDEARVASAEQTSAASQLAAALQDLQREQQEHATARLTSSKCREQAAESARGQAAAEEALQGLRAELQQHRTGAAQHGAHAQKLEEELMQTRHDKEASSASLSELDSRCRKLQKELQRAEQQLDQERLRAPTAAPGQLAGHEAALQSTLQDTQQKLQQALTEKRELESRLQELQSSSAHISAAPDSNGHGMTANPLFSGAPQDTPDLSEKLAEKEQELERTKQQLQRLKQAMMARQDDEEDGVRWRVEAEVRLAVDRAQQAAAQQEAQMHKDMADLQAELAHAMEQLKGQGVDLAEWRDALAAKDLEIQNLQAALGELAYKSETAERLRMDLRAQVAKTREAEGRCDSARLEIEASNGAQLALRNELEAARQQLERQRRLEERLSDEAAMLRRALSQSMQQLKLANSDEGAMVDRRVLKKLLLTWVERGRSDHSILNLMSSMLGFTEEEKRSFGGAQGPGIIKTVAGAPIALIRGLATNGGGTPLGKDGLANQWVDFLIEQANAADSVQELGPSRSVSGDQGQ